MNPKSSMIHEHYELSADDLVRLLGIARGSKVTAIHYGGFNSILGDKISILTVRQNQ